MGNQRILFENHENFENYRISCENQNNHERNVSPELLSPGFWYRERQHRENVHEVRKQENYVSLGTVLNKFLIHQV